MPELATTEVVPTIRRDARASEIRDPRRSSATAVEITRGQRSVTRRGDRQSAFAPHFVSMPDG